MGSEKDFHKQETVFETDEPVLEQKAVPELPQKIGSYLIESLLSEGGMGVVFLAKHEQTGQVVSLKTLSAKYLANTEVKERFIKEAEIIALADHTNIIKLYGHGEWEGGLYIAMEFIHGLTLRQFIAPSDTGSLTKERALEIITQVAAALTHLHTHGVIHRDLKPENILLTESGAIKVIDFGISEHAQNIKVSSRLVGTPTYMSPEQCADPSSVSYASDIYALGVIAYELFTGTLSHGHIKLHQIPPVLRKILAKCLQPKPQDRYEDVVDFAITLKDYRMSPEFQGKAVEIPQTDTGHEFSQDLIVAQRTLVPQSPPTWPQIDVGIGHYIHESDITGIYYDFFDLPKGSLGIVMAECGKKGAAGLVYTAVLRGYVRSLARLTAKPVELVTILNELILKDSIDEIFTLSYLILYPGENQLKFISCGFGKLWYGAQGHDSVKRLSADNIALGLSLDVNFLEVTNSWSSGDTVVMSSFGAAQNASAKTSMEDLVFSQLCLSAPKQAEAIVLHAKKNNISTGRPLSVISTYRH